MFCAPLLIYRALYDRITSLIFTTVIALNRGCLNLIPITRVEGGSMSYPLDPIKAVFHLREASHE